MQKLYGRRPLAFSLIWIVVYVVGLSLADGASAALGMEKAVTAPVALGLCLLLLGWSRKNGLWAELGLKGGSWPGKVYLWFLPLAVLVSTNFWGGAALQLSVPETALYVVSMAAVGILEEILFRGLLMRVLCRENMARGLVISALTFGIGHIVNLLNGAAMVPTLLQILYATAVGFLFGVIFLRSGSLLPCIVTHCAVNCGSAFGAPRGPGLDMAAAAVLTVVAAGYAGWIWIKTTENRILL